MNRMVVLTAVAAAAASMSAAAAPARAGIAFDELQGGDLSDDRLAPTALTLGDGPNLVAGQFGPTSATDPTLDLDYVTLTVPAGRRLDRLTLAAASVGGGFSFVGVEAGGRVSVPHTTESAASLLGYAHFGSSDVGQDLLPAIAAGRGAQGFTAPLPAGDYTFWLMELSTTGPASYAFDAHTSPVPEPAAAAIFATAAGLSTTRRRRNA